jgi:hypothetical protein
MNEAYRQQVRLLLDVLPEVARETCFALHGGTATRVQHKADACKLQIEDQGINIKIEVNMVVRGLIGEVKQVELCVAAQTGFDAFCVMPLVPLAHLYGGKICAALDRQHPRDLFDVKLLQEGEGITGDIKRGIIYGLVSSNRPTHELLAPNLLDQQAAFENQFEGMSTTEFSYADFRGRQKLAH